MKKLTIILFLCFLCNSIYSQDKLEIKNDTTNLAILVSDYQTYNFEKGNLSYYSPFDSIVNKIPIESKFEAPVDFGSISFVNIITNDTLFSAVIVWQGQGSIIFPKDFLPADSFAISQASTQAPLSIEYYFNTISNLDTVTYKMKADSAWNNISNLDIVNEFAKYPYRVGLYLYTPGEGVPTPNGFSDTVGAKWIIFLYYDNSTISRIQNAKNLPGQFVLDQNYPNPFNPTTIINYEIPKGSIVTIKVYDLLGRKVAELVNEDKSAGNYKVNFNASNLSSGIYFYQLRAGNYISTKKMILMK